MRADDNDVADDVENLQREITRTARELADHAERFARLRPHAAVGLALVVGWVLGHGLPPQAVLRAARLGWRTLLAGALAGLGAVGVAAGADHPAKPFARTPGPNAARHDGG